MPSATRTTRRPTGTSFGARAGQFRPAVARGAAGSSPRPLSTRPAPEASRPLPALPLDDRPDAQQAKATRADGGGSDGRGLPNAVVLGENARCGGDFLYRKSTAGAGKPGSGSANWATCAARDLVRNPGPTCGKTCTLAGQAGTGGDERPSGGSAVSAMMDADCGIMSYRVSQRATGLEPATFSLEG